MPRDDPEYFDGMDLGDDWQMSILRFRRPWPTTFDEAFDALGPLYVNFEPDKEGSRRRYDEAYATVGEGREIRRPPP
jgi:hypothetical protein